MIIANCTVLATSVAGPDPSVNRANGEHFDDVLATVDRGAPHAQPGGGRTAAGDQPPAQTQTVAGAEDVTAMLSRAAGGSEGHEAKGGTDTSPDATGNDAAATVAAGPNAAPAELLGLLASAFATAAQGAARTRTPAPAAAGQPRAAAVGPAGTGIAGGATVPPETASVTLSHVAVTGQIAPAARLATAAGDGAASGADATKPATEKGPAGGKDAAGEEDAPATIAPQGDAPHGAGVQPTGAGVAPAIQPAGLPTTSTRAPTAPAGTAASSRAADVPTDRTVTTLAPARTLTLQLSPSNLGTVDVRLHATGSTLDVGLTVSDQQTLGMIRREHDALAGALRGGNYGLNSLTIQGADTTSGDQNAQGRSFTAGQNGSQSRPDGQASAAGGSGGRGAGGGAGTGGRDGAGGGDAGDARARGADGADGGGALFV